MQVHRTLTWATAVFAMLAVALFASGSPAAAAAFHVDPENGSPEGDGSRAAPWATLQGVIERDLIATRVVADPPFQQGAALKAKNPQAPVGPGDTIYLYSGDHGRLILDGAHNTKAITIRAAPDATPRLSRIRLHGASRWVLRGLHVSPSAKHANNNHTPLVALNSHPRHGPTHHVTVQNCTVYSIQNAADWGPDQWNAMARDGIRVTGDHVTLRGNVVSNIDSGISVSGSHAHVIDNVVAGFIGDGMRGNGDHGVFEYNTIKNAYDVNDNHDDGFQSWSMGPQGPGSGTVKDVVLRGNLIINHEDPNHPLRSRLQGIGCFDGTYIGWVIENNVVITDHPHGITLLGLRDCRIVNNTVADLAPGRREPWIMVGAHKNGTPPRDVLVRNNLARAYRIADGRDITADHNMTVEDRDRFYVAPAEFDMHLKPDAPAIDAGAPDMAPRIDRDGKRRPQGHAVDLGAYERAAGSTE